MHKIENITIIGTGNVSWHISRALFNEGFQIEQLVGRQEDKTEAFAARVFAEPITDLGNINSDSDLYILAVSDGAIAEVAAQMPLVEGIVAHTSGAIGLDVLKKFQNHGVFYPLQTFTEGRMLSFEDLPILVEGNTHNTEDLLADVARELTLKVHRINSAKREKLHIAAVFVCNFVNHMYTIGKDICDQNQLPFDVLHALMTETTKKAISSHPKEVQTGPAKRNDQLTLQKHMEDVGNNDLKMLYDIISNHIKKTHETQL
jgi:predicted short-subunit dehydrogenase-like oxidoreductase (DUF2520 family)